MKKRAGAPADVRTSLIVERIATAPREGDMPPFVVAVDVAGPALPNPGSSHERNGSTNLFLHLLPRRIFSHFGSWLVAIKEFETYILCPGKIRRKRAAFVV
ncbi:MAG TPA: hypothetical protein VKG25_22760 [Bryobacteraceae bacterium]|nr:hypothetical protein [Bryobacteraceae bacterium]